mgnify:CR=1 FL=1
MKKKIISGIVIIVMAIVANYPIYKDLRASAQVAQDAINDVNALLIQVQSEVNVWKDEVNTLTTRIDSMKVEFTSAIDSLKHEALENVNKEVEKTEKQVKDKVKQIIPGIPGF